MRQFPLVLVLTESAKSKVRGGGGGGKWKYFKLMNDSNHFKITILRYTHMIVSYILLAHLGLITPGTLE